METQSKPFHHPGYNYGSPEMGDRGILAFVSTFLVFTGWVHAGPLLGTVLLIITLLVWHHRFHVMRLVFVTPSTHTKKMPLAQCL